MALATQCPHCQTTFRVANDQLKLRAGLVRCGACREVFNGIEHLVRPDRSVSADATVHPSPEESTDQSQATSTSAIAATISTPIAAEMDSIPAEAKIATTTSAVAPPEQHPVEVDATATDQSLSPATEVAPAAHAESLPSLPSPPAIVVDDADEDRDEPANAATPASELSGAEPSHAAGVSSESTEQKLAPAALTARSPNVWHRPYIHNADSHSNDDDPLQRMTLFQVAPAVEDEGDAADAFAADQADVAEDQELDRLIDELQNQPWPGQKKNSLDHTIGSDANVIYGEVRQENEHDTTHAGQDVIAEPSFMQQARRKQRVGGVMRTGMSIACVLLLFGLIGQASYTFRDQLAARVPQLKPMLQSTCRKLGCQIGLPMKIDGISIESNELQSIAPARNLFALTLLMRNQSSNIQAWPNIELTLNDASEKAIVRRVFTPRDYLPTATDLAQGFARDTEQSIKLSFELLQLKASGYRVYLFYP